MSTEYFNILTKRYEIPRSERLSVLKKTIKQLNEVHSTVSKLLGVGNNTTLNLGGVIIHLQNEYNRIKKL
jgi:hypothetical protein